MVFFSSLRRQLCGSFKIAIFTFVISCLLYVALLLRWQHIRNIPPSKNVRYKKRHFVRSESFAFENVSCKNSIQGKFLISDSRGYICSRDEIHQTNGCCIHFTDNTRKKESIHADTIKSDGRKYRDGTSSEIDTTLKQFDCRNCNLKIGCCQEYEHCISCCLKPEHLEYYYDSYLDIPILQRNIKSDSNTSKSLDYFDYCQFVCRTSSLSVQNENSYRGSHNYCYSRSQAPVEKNPVNSDWTGFIRPKL